MVMGKHYQGVCPETRNEVPEMLRLEQSGVTDTKEIANGLNTYFISVADRYIPDKKTDPAQKQYAFRKLSDFVDNKIEQDATFSIAPVSTVLY